MHEIVLPETKPALEWVNDRALQKVSPQRRHSLAQSEFLVALLAWAREDRRGRVGPEWEFRLQPPSEIRRPLVPDVAYLSYARLPRESKDEAEIPRIAPDAVVEVISSGESRRDIEDKVRVYLACGTVVVFLVDTGTQTVTIRDAQSAKTLGRDAIVAHPSLPGFAVPARMLFEEP